MCKKKNHNKNFESLLTRRQALAIAGKGAAFASIFDPGRILLGSLVDGVISEARAAAGVKPRSYVHISLDGGPQRWAWDLPLAPYESVANVVGNNQVVTGFANAGANAGAAQYLTVPITRGGVTVNMPQLWASSLPLVGGGTAPMADLLESMLSIRGVNLQQDGHPNNKRRQIRPVASAPSLGGRVADFSDTPVPAVSVAGAPWEDHKSEKGIGQVYYQSNLNQYADPLGEILKPFNGASDGLTTTYVNRRNALDAVLKSALSSLGAYANSSSPGASNLHTLANSAETLIRTGIGNVSSSFHTLRLKYEALISACASSSMVGITDKPILKANYSNDHLRAGGSSTYATNADLRGIVVSTSAVGNLAGSFAVIEYLLKNNYSCSIMCGISGVDTLNFGGASNEYWGFDEHTGGAIPSLIINAFMYRALSACLFELIAVLKANNLYGETVIHIGGDFSRAPNHDGMGSEHGWEGSVATLFSGAIKQPLFVGNTLKNYGNPAQKGSWGAAGKINVDGSNRELTIGHSTSTICELLRVAHLMPNDGSLITEPVAGDGIVATVETAKLV